MLTGYTALVEELELRVPRPHTESRFSGSVRRREVLTDKTTETYPEKKKHAGAFRDHLHFALKNEPTELAVLVAAFKKVGPEPIRNWVLEKPTGTYSRKAWFLYEFLVGEQIDLANARRGNYVDVLDPKRQFTGERHTSPRHRVWNNLLGVPGYCPTVRRTETLSRRVSEALDRKIAEIADSIDPTLLRRAVNYLYSKETRSSFEIEGLSINPKREELFVNALAHAAETEPQNKSEIIGLQNAIVDERYAATDWRDFQNYVGETVSGFKERVHLVCPKPEDIRDLMSGWEQCTRRLLSDSVDPVIAAAIISFGFVFIHPFEDGNGRIHRFLIHNILAKKGFSPKGVIFPVSVAIVRDTQSYDIALETFSKPLLSLIDWQMINVGTPEQTVSVEGETADLYRYFDATPLAEYLYDRIAETINKDLVEELEFLRVYDRAYEGVRDIVDMPNKKISLFVRLCMQNNGRLPNSRRKHFQELAESEIAEMENAVSSACDSVKDELENETLFSV